MIDRAFEAFAVESLKGYVSCFAKRYLGHGFGLEELEQEGTIGLIKAIRRWDPERGASLKTFSCLYIKGAIRKMLGADTEGNLFTDPCALSTTVPLSSEGNFLPQIHGGPFGTPQPLVFSDTPESLYSEEEEANQYLRLLSPTELAVLQQRFVNDQTCEASGTAIGVSHSQAHRIECGAIEKMQAHAKGRMAS